MPAKKVTASRTPASPRAAAAPTRWTPGANPFPSDAAAGIVSVVNNYSTQAVKNALDDAVKEFLHTTHLSSHRHEDTRLVLGWSAVFVSAGISLYGLRVKFAESKLLILAAVVIYAALSGLLSLYVTFIERGIIFDGQTKIGAKATDRRWITIVSKLKPRPVHDPVYTLQYESSLSSAPNQASARHASGIVRMPISEYFDSRGVLAKRKLESALKQLSRDASP